MLGAVDGRPCRLVVDTGAERTFAREEMVAAQDLPVSGQQLFGVTSHCLTLRGPVTSKIAVDRVEEELPVYVADIEEPCLLGFFCSECSLYRLKEDDDEGMW